MEANRQVYLIILREVDISLRCLVVIVRHLHKVLDHLSLHLAVVRIVAISFNLVRDLFVDHVVVLTLESVIKTLELVSLVDSRDII